MCDPMREIMKLFLVLAEDSKTFDEVRPLVDQLFHDECRVQTEEQCLNKARIMADMEELVKNKVTMQLTRVEQDECGLTYDYKIRKPRERTHKMTAAAMVRDGKIYHVDVKKDASTAPSAEAKMRRVSAPIIHGI